jgi:uncharacterized RDD family membrane protein YckC
MENEDFKFTPLPEAAVRLDEPLIRDEGEQQAYGLLQPAGFNERFIAYVIDALPFVLGAKWSMHALIKAGVMRYSFGGELKWKLVWIICYIIYEGLLSSGGRATVGKLIMGLRVKAADGGDLSLPRAFLRGASYFLSSGTMNLGYLLALFTPQKRALHDYVAGSRVISLNGERSDLAGGLIIAASWSLMAIFIGSWLNQTVLKISPAEKVQIRAAHRTIAKLAKLEDIYMAGEGHYTNDLRRLADLTGNVNAVRAELYRTLEPDTLVIASNGRKYIITAKARNWRKTEVQVVSQKDAPFVP